MKVRNSFWWNNKIVNENYSESIKSLTIVDHYLKAGPQIIAYVKCGCKVI